MALLVAAVAAVLEEDWEVVDIDAYAASLGAMPLENLPAADEEGLPYPKRAGEILADYYRRLQPAMRRVVEYGVFMLPDLIEPRWLEWLLSHDSSGSASEHHHIALGRNRAGECRQPAAIVREAIAVGLLRRRNRAYPSGSGECLALHRLHRKEASRRMTVDRRRMCWESLSALLSWIARPVSLGHEEWERVMGGLAEGERRNRCMLLIDSVDLFAAGVGRAIRESLVAHAEPTMCASQLLLEVKCEQSGDRAAAEALVGGVIEDVSKIAENLWEWTGWGGAIITVQCSSSALVEKRMWWSVGFELSWMHLCRGHIRASLSRSLDAEVDFDKAWYLVADNIGHTVDWRHVPVGYVVSTAVARMHMGDRCFETGSYELAKRWYGEAIGLGDTIRLQLMTSGKWRHCYRDGLSRAYRGRSAALRALGCRDDALLDERQAAVIESLGDRG